MLRRLVKNPFCADAIDIAFLQASSISSGMTDTAKFGFGFRPYRRVGPVVGLVDRVDDAEE